MYGPHQNLHSFPTRRSSDLLGEAGTAPEDGPLGAHRARKGGLLAVPLTPLGAATSRGFERRTRGVPQVPRPRAAVFRRRSEEHTSELQSQSNIVCRLLLEHK